MSFDAWGFTYLNYAHIQVSGGFGEPKGESRHGTS